MTKTTTILYTLLFSFTLLTAQQYRSPLDIPLFLSGNFGELRNNHFHSGIDLKTQAVINKPVYSIEDGFISRINISPSGYGLAIYVDHPKTGHTSVYAHINKFPDYIEKFIKDEQYKQEAFRLDIKLDASKFPIKKGDLIAYSGNSGSSGGPHVHFEIRDTKSETVLDALVYYKNQIADNVAPDIRGIAIYPKEGEGMVNNSSSPFRYDLRKNKKGKTLALPTIKAYGTISLGVKAYDRMSKTANIYGVKIVRLFVNDDLIFKSDIKSYGFDQTRMLNSFVDFEDWRSRKSFFMKSFVEPGNKLPFYETKNNGYIKIEDGKTYNIKYELEDLYGNISRYNFSIEGSAQKIAPSAICSQHMLWDHDNQFIRDDFSLIIEKGNLYDNLRFNFKQTNSNSYFSDIFTVNASPIPLHKNGTMRIKLKNDSIANKKQYGIVQVNAKSDSWVGGTYSNGHLQVNLNELGKKYAVTTDQNAPHITPVNEKLWAKQSSIKVKLSDDLSGIESFRGEIDGKFVLFTHDVKSSAYTYKFDEKTEKGKTHQFVFKATDRCGNVSEYKAEFYY